MLTKKVKKTEFPKIKSMNSTLQFTKKSKALVSKTTSLLGGFVFVCLILLSNTSFAQVATNYSYSELAGPASFVDLPSDTKTQLITGQWDNGVVNTAIGFPFVFNGTSYNNMNVSANGFITFGATAPTDTNSTPISSTEGYAGAIAIHGSDMNVGTILDDALFPGNQANSVSKIIAGASPNRILKIEYRFARRIGTGSVMSFQIWLYETTNVIELHYRPTGTLTGATPGQIGLRGPTNADFNNRLWTTNATWPTLPTTTSAGSSNISVVVIRNFSIAPGSNRLLRYSPVSCSSPTTPGYNTLLSSSVNLTWGAPVPVPTGYVYEVRSSGAAGSGAAGLVSTGTVATSPATATGLTAGTTYTAYVRSDCGVDGLSGWVSCGTFTTLCAPTSVPYTKYMDPGSDGFIIPAIPACMTKQNTGGNQWVTVNSAPYSDMFDEHLIYNFNATQAANAWVYTQGINMIAGQTYRLSYLYGGSSQFTFITNKMKVMYGTAPEVASMSTLLDDHPIIKTSAFSNVVNFTAPSTGVFYFGFQAYSDANNGELFLDDIEIFTSTCISPTAIVIPPALVTFNSALVTWTAPVPAPAGGYAYYLSTSATPPVNGTPPTGTLPAGTTITTLNSLASNTTYYLWVRGICAVGEYSEWSTSGTFTTAVAPPVYCIPTGTSVDGQGITNVAFGSINNTTGNEAATNYYGDYSGLTTNVAQGATIPVAITFNTSFFDYETMIWIDWNNDGDFVDALEQVYSGTSSSVSPNTLNASFVVPGGATLGPKRMRIGGIDSPIYTGGALTPCRNGAFQTFEDYTVNVIVAPPALTISSATSTQCGNTNSPLVTITSPLANFDVYSWSPAAGVTGTPGTGYTFNTGTSTTYILTASQTSGAFSTNTVSFRYVANDTPTPITIATPSGTTACQSGPPIPLNATGGVVSNITIASEDFNSGFPATWTSTNTSVNGTNTANPAWTVRPNNHNTGFIWSTTLSSNDASSFIISNSDAQGNAVPGSQTRTTLISAPIDLTTGYTAASLSFWHYFRYIGANDFAYVQVSTSGVGGPYTNLIQYTSTQGAPTNFAQSIINLNPYLGQTIHIRFNYQSNWGWGWAVDNFKVSGSATSSIIWTPVAGLYSDAAGTVPYVLGAGANTVYAMPNLNTTYTASASTPGPIVCNAVQTVDITTVNVVAGTVAGGGQVVCNPADLTNLTLTGSTGDVIRWEYASDAAFTVGVTAIANTTTTLTPAQFGSFGGIRYFRAVVGNVANSCNVRFTPSVSIDLPSTTQSGTSPADVWSNGTPDITKKVIITGDYTVSSDISACSIEVLLGATMTVTNAATVTVDGGITVDPMAGPTAVVFESNTSLLQNSTSNTINSGSVRYIRESTPIIQYDYTYWSSPVDFQIIKNFSPNTANVRFYTFDSGPAYAWAAVPSVTTHLMGAGIGYIIRAPSNISATVPAPWSGEFYGRLRNGSYAVPVNVVGGIQNRNLLGNPYPSAIDADLLYAENPTTLTGNFYFWTHNTPSVGGQIYTADDYAQYNASGGVGTSSVSTGLNNTPPNGNIAAGQGFFVEGAASGTVTFNNSIRVSGNNDLFYRSQPIEKHRVWLNVLNTQGAFKQTLVGYIEGATDERDSRFDGDYVETGNVVALYSLLDQEKLTIQGRALPFMDTDVVPLGFKTTIEGTFQIQLADFDGLFAQGQDIYLEDKLLNITHDLRSGDYSFTTNAGTFEDRFDLKYQNSTLSVPTFNEEAIIVYQNNQTLFINSGVTEMARVRLMDVRGRLIAEKAEVNATEVQFSQLNVSKQVLLVQITTLDGTIVTKRVIY